MPGRQRDGDAPGVHIARATIRVPGVDAGDGEAFGRDVARGLERALARQPAGGAPRALGALDLRVELPDGGDAAERAAALGERIADAIARAVWP